MIEKIYEGMFLFDVGFASDFSRAESTIQRIMDRSEAKLLACKKWDERRLAYEIGGRRRGIKRGRPNENSHKVPVFGVVERKGKVVAVTVKNAKRATIMPHIIQRVIPASQVYTDEFRSYDRLSKNGFKHDRVNHMERVYVSGDVHTNTIEGFWSLVKRGIGGVYHAVSSKHLQGYLNEYSWRYNHRNGGRVMFETLLLRALGR